jgi:hypothetical protein
LIVLRTRFAAAHKSNFGLGNRLRASFDSATLGRVRKSQFASDLRRDPVAQRSCQLRCSRFIHWMNNEPQFSIANLQQAFPLAKVTLEAIALKARPVVRQGRCLNDDRTWMNW